MKKYILLFIMVVSFLTPKAQTLYDQDGLTLYYTSSIYNTVTVEGTDFYDQYEVKVFFKNGSGKPIFSPDMLYVEWNKDALLKAVRKFYTYEEGGALYTKTKYMKDSFPQSALSIMFGFPDGKRVHYNQPPPKGSDAAAYHEYLMLNGQIDSCKLYILVEQGVALPTPKWNVPTIKYKDNFDKKYLTNFGLNECGCTGKNKPRGKRGDKPKGMSENGKKNGVNNAPVETKLRSVEELKTAILENLRTFTAKESHREKTYPDKPYLMKYNTTEVTFDIINEELHISWTEDDHWADESWAHFMPKKYKTIIPLKVIQFITKYGSSLSYRMEWEIEKLYTQYRTYQVNCKEYQNDIRARNLTPGSQKYTDDCQLVDSHFTPGIPYEEGVDKVNLKALDRAFKDLYKQLNGK
jgi:hypothetical protein